MGALGITLYDLLHDLFPAVYTVVIGRNGTILEVYHCEVPTHKNQTSNAQNDRKNLYEKYFYSRGISGECGSSFPDSSINDPRREL